MWPVVKSLFARFGKIFLLAVGVIAVTALVKAEGADRVWKAVSSSARWLPVLILCDVLIAVCDALATRSVMGDRAKNVPLRAWVRSSGLAYAMMTFVPAGRAGGEVARATTLSKYVPGALTAAAALKQQAAILFANSIISIGCSIAICARVGFWSTLNGLIWFNLLSTLIVGAVLVVVTRKSRGSKLVGKILHIGERGAAFDEAMASLPRVPWPAIGYGVLGRLVQTFQYGLIVFAIGGALSLDVAMRAQGIHLVGAAFGDFVPNQVGFNEGAYAIFADVIDLDRARAVSLALIARISSFSSAGIAMVVAFVAKEHPAPTATTF